MEDAVDQYEDHLGTYLVKFTGRELSTAQNEEVSKFLHTSAILNASATTR